VAEQNHESQAEEVRQRIIAALSRSLAEQKPNSSGLVFDNLLLHCRSRGAAQTDGRGPGKCSRQVLKQRIVSDARTRCVFFGLQTGLNVFFS
jgi:hypothetical protein